MSTEHLNDLLKDARSGSNSVAAPTTQQLSPAHCSSSATRNPDFQTLFEHAKNLPPCILNRPWRGRCMKNALLSWSSCALAALPQESPDIP